MRRNAQRATVLPPLLSCHMWVLLSVVGACGIGCSSDDAQTKQPSTAQVLAETDSGAARLPGETFDASCCTRRDLDLNRNGKADAYQFTRVVDGETLVVRKEVDINNDGKIDLVRNLNEKGELVEERLDTDFDAKVDLIVYFDRGNIVKKENDTNFDDKVDMWRYFDKGMLLREEADLNYDGKVDYWEYFEGGKLDRVGIDRDNDGKVDEWLNQTENAG